MSVVDQAPLSPKEAAELQRQLANRVQVRALDSTPRLVAGFDLSIRGSAARAAAAVVEYKTLQVVEEVVVPVTLDFPYVPGLLAFREAPAILATYSTLSSSPDVLMLDGHGLAHPRRFGIACHVGVALNVPSFGVAKSLLVGLLEDPPPERGGTSPIVHRGEVVGMAVRTRSAAKPVYVSVGHLITLDEAVKITLEMAPKWRVPEPTRRAHTLAGQWDVPQ